MLTALKAISAYLESLGLSGKVLTLGLQPARQALQEPLALEHPTVCSSLGLFKTSSSISTQGALGMACGFLPWL